MQIYIRKFEKLSPNVGPFEESSLKQSATHYN